jgi:hypothetical protein
LKGKINERPLEAMGRQEISGVDDFGASFLGAGHGLGRRAPELHAGLQPF